MIFDAKPVKFDAMDRQLNMQKHPLGEPQSRAPWLPTPEKESRRDLVPAPTVAEAAAIPAAGARSEIITDRERQPNACSPLPQRPPQPQHAPLPSRQLPVEAGHAAAPADGSAQLLEPPAMEDLFALYKLCGGNVERCINLLARLWEVSVARIAPVVRSWLSLMPEVPPPSRMRSAPVTLPSELSSRLHDLGAAAGVPGGGGATIAFGPAWRRPPPVSAPATHTGRTAASFDVRALQRAVERGASLLPSQTYKLPTLPEGGPHLAPPPAFVAGRLPPPKVDEADEESLAAFAYQSRMGGTLTAAALGGNRPGLTRHMR